MVNENVREMYMMVFAAIIIGIMIILVINLLDIYNVAQVEDTAAYNATSNWMGTLVAFNDIFSILILIIIVVVVFFFIKTLNNSI